MSSIAYPFEFSPTQFTERGLLVLTVDASGEASCIACGSCEVVCPAQSITLSSSNYGHRTHTHFNLDYARCIFCGFCVSACPTDAIVHTPFFSLAVERHENLVWGTETLYSTYVMA